MKILHVIPSVEPQSGGPAAAILPMCRALRKEGLDVLLVTTDVGIPAETATVRKTALYKEVPTLFFASSWGDSFKFSKGMAVWLDENVKSFDVVHIHAVFNHACIAASRACRKHGVPYLVRPLGSLDTWSLSQKRLRKQVFWQLHGERMLREAAVVHYTAEAELSSAEARLDLHNGTVVPLGIDALDLESISDERLTSAPYVLTLSRLHPKKALDVLIDAFLQTIRDDNLRNWQLIIAGTGDSDYLNSLLDRVRRVNAGNHVAFTGWVEGHAKWQLLRQASLLALTSYQENFGVSVLEALSCEVPVIVSSHVNLARDIESAGAGWVCEVERSSLGATLREALSSEELRAQRGASGREFAKQFAWSRVAEELKNLYFRVARQSLCAHVVA